MKRNQIHRTLAGLLLCVTVASSCSGNDKPGVSTEPSVPVTTEKAVVDPPQSSLPFASKNCPVDPKGQQLGCVLVDREEFEGDWWDLETTPLGIQNESTGIEEVPLCGKTVGLTPEKKVGSRIVSADPNLVDDIGAALDAAARGKKIQGIEVSQSASLFRSTTEAQAGLDEVEAIARSCGASWLDKDKVKHLIVVKRTVVAGASVIVIETHANPFESWAGQSNEEACKDRDGQLELMRDLAQRIGQDPKVAESVVELMCNGTLQKMAITLAPLSEITITAHVGVEGPVLVSSLIVASAMQPPSFDPNTIHSAMRRRAKSYATP
jgi:hypothetical protein